MGVSIGMSSSSFDTGSYSGKSCNCGCNCKSDCPNPNPMRYSIKRVQKEGDFLIIKINYPDCTTFEGNKILVYKGCTIVNLVEQGKIDPHFSENKDFLSPIARFRPDDEGWKMAESFVKSII